MAKPPYCARVFCSFTSASVCDRLVLRNYTPPIRVDSIGEPRTIWPTIPHWPLSRRLDRCDRVIQDETGDSFGGNVQYVTKRITFVTRKFGNVERNSHCDVLHVTTVRVAMLFLDCNGVFAIKAYGRCNT